MNQEPRILEVVDNKNQKTSIDVTQTYIHALSQLEFHYKPGCDNHEFTSANQDVRNTIALLEGLALLLVFNPSGDIAATTVWKESGKIIIFWSKNKSVADLAKIAYVESLCERIEAGKQLNDILALVIENCRSKIISRCKQLARAFDITAEDRKPNQDNLCDYNGTRAAAQKIRDELIRSKLLGVKQSTSQLLDRFIRRCATIQPNHSPIVLRRLLLTAWALSNVEAHKIFFSEKRATRIRKLGDYARGACALRARVAKFKNEGIKIEVRQVSPPNPGKVSVFLITTRGMNLRCDLSGEVRIKSFVDVKKLYDKAKEGDEDDGAKEGDKGDKNDKVKTVRVTQHCEITLVLHLMKLAKDHSNKMHVDIGVSKATCEWCQDYLNLLRVRTAGKILNFAYRASHGKKPDGWGIPTYDPFLASHMAQRVEERLDSAIIRITERCWQSDTIALPSEIEELGQDCEGFDFDADEDVLLSSGDEDVLLSSGDEEEAKKRCSQNNRGGC